MAETNNLKEVYQNVFESSKKIINKNQRNLFINTLDLIARTTNTISANFLTDDIIKFLYTDILELVFDEDINIQNNAIAAMETVLKMVDSNSFQNSVEWAPICLNIIEKYSEKLHSMRQQNNSNWHKVWGLIMRIIKQEIIRSASTINKFLFVVELGFRSTDQQVRAESFKSWKVLVEIFSEHDLTSLKRIKLISIPLRSSQAKTEPVALHKFKVWWFFITKLQENGCLLGTSELTFEPFLSFCFGSKDSTSQLKPYSNVKEMAVISLIEMLNSTKVKITYELEKLELEKSSGTVIKQELFNKHFEIIIRSVCEASIIILEEFAAKKKIIFKLLWKNLMDHVVNNGSTECYKECFDGILLLINMNKPESKESLNQIVCSLGTNKNFLWTDCNENGLNVEKVAKKIIYFSKLLFSSPNKFFTIDETLISSIYRIECFSKSLKYWDLIKLFIEYFLENFRNADLNEIINNIDIKLLVWEEVSRCLTSYLKENSFEFRLTSKAKVLNEWILLPIKKGSSYLNDHIFKCWKEITVAASKSVGRSTFIMLISPEIKKVHLEVGRIDYLVEIIITMIECLDIHYEQCTYPKQIFVLLLNVLSYNNLSAKAFNKVLEKFIFYFKQLEQNEFSLCLSDVIGILKCLQKLEKSGAKGHIEIFKKVILEGIMKHCNANQIKEYKQALKSNDDFVIIPTVWTMNPDRLTDHQKEKMKERKNNLPALYNDMSSHSQDTYSLKSWAPNKIIISKNKDNQEIVVPDSNEIILVESPRQGKNLEQQNIASEKLDTNSAEEVNLILNGEKNQGAENLDTTSKSDSKLASCCKTKQDLIAGKSSDNGQSKSSSTENIESNTKDSSITIAKNMKRHKSMFVDKSEKVNVTGVTTRRSTRLNSTIPAESVRRTTRTSLKKTNENKTTLRKKRISNKEKIAKNNKTLSDDEIIQSSQPSSESVISRRKSLVSSIVSAAKAPIEILEKNPAKNSGNIESLKRDDNSKIKSDLSEQSKPIAATNTEDSSESSVIMVIPSNSGKIIEISSNNLFEADTQINTEPEVNHSNDEIPVKPITQRNEVQSDQFKIISPNMESGKISPVKRKSPRKQLNFEDVAEEANLSSSPKLKSLENFADERAIQSPVFSPRKSRKINEEKSRNSILCSPDNQTLEQTREFICNTSNISPIGEEILEDKTEIQNDKPASEVVLEIRDNLIMDISNDVDKQLSPTTRRMTAQISLSSPSDRKKTVNALSPTPKGKTSTLTGRGAQLINMIRNRNTGGQTLKDGDISFKRVLETSILNNRPSPNGPESSRSGLIANMITSTPQPSTEKDLLTFSKVLPSPYASPTASILKRKANRISLDETELQASKRKRVGFSDPVSITKEYALQPEEDKISINHPARAALHKVLYPTTKSPSSSDHTQKHLLKRKSRVDSMIEIAKYNDNTLTSPVQLSKAIRNLPTSSTMMQSELPEDSQQISPVMLNDINEMESFKLVETPNSNINNANQSNNCDEEILGTKTSPKKSVTEDDLDSILNKYTLDDLLLKYIEKSNKTSQDLLTMKTVKTLMREIMNSMRSDEKIQTIVLESLSEKYPKEYLDHAIQENLCTVVCDRLDFNSVLTYVFEKSKINNQCQKLVLENMYRMFNSDKHINDKYELIQKLLKSRLQLTTEEILNSIELLMQQKKS